MPGWGTLIAQNKTPDENALDSMKESERTTSVRYFEVLVLELLRSRNVKSVRG